MRNLGPVEAASEIRQDVLNMPGLDPEEQHGVAFVKSVCDQLGLEHSGENMHRVAVTLHKHDIALHVGHEYPKMVVRKYDRTSHIAHSADEEDQIVNAERSVPVEAAPYVQEPVQDTALDLQDKVPHVEPMKHAVGRDSDAFTNASARQEPGVMTSDGDNDAVHDHNPSSEPEPEFVEGDENEDGSTAEEVVVEDPKPVAAQPYRKTRPV